MKPFTIAALFLLSLTTVSDAQDAKDTVAVTLDSRMTKLAESLRDYLVSVKENKITVGSFTAFRAEASGGAAIKRMLKKKLAQAGITCQPGCDYYVDGKYQGTKQPNEDLFALHVSATVQDKGNNEVKTINVAVHNVQDIASVLGLTGKIPASGEKEQSVTKVEQKPSREIKSAEDPKDLLMVEPVAVKKTADATERHKALEEISAKPQAKISFGDSGDGIPSIVRPTENSCMLPNCGSTAVMSNVARALQIPRKAAPLSVSIGASRSGSRYTTRPTMTQSFLLPLTV